LDFIWRPGRISHEANLKENLSSGRGGMKGSEAEMQQQSLGEL